MENKPSPYFSRLIVIKCGAAFGSCKREDEIEFEVPVDATDEDIQKEAEKFAWEHFVQNLDVWATVTEDHKTSLPPDIQ